MEAENIKDPRDLNGDGKVTIDEKIKYAAGKAGEKLSEVAGEVKEGAKKLYDKAAPKVKEGIAEAKSKIESLKEKKEDGKEGDAQP